MNASTPKKVCASALCCATVALGITWAGVGTAAAEPLPECRSIARGAWIETLCSVHSTKEQCEAAKQARGGVIVYRPDPSSPSAIIGRPGTLQLTCIGPDGGASATTAVGGTSDGLWHLAHIGP